MRNSLIRNEFLILFSYLISLKKTWQAGISIIFSRPFEKKLSLERLFEECKYLQEVCSY